jgi:membrane protein DedA with SNARE-associated domain
MPAIETFIEQFTYVGIFLTLFAGSLGLPIPEEVPILLAGVLAREAVIHRWLALPVCLVGVLLGDVVLYWVGHHWGNQILGWRVVHHVLTPERANALKESYRRHGVKIVFTARHVMGLRAAAFLTAGVAHVPFWKFIAVDAGAACISVPLAFTLGYVFTDQLEELVRAMHRIERWLALGGLTVLAAWLVVLVWRRGRHVE